MIFRISYFIFGSDLNVTITFTVKSVYCSIFNAFHNTRRTTTRSTDFYRKPTKVNWTKWIQITRELSSVSLDENIVWKWSSWRKKKYPRLSLSPYCTAESQNCWTIYQDYNELMDNELKRQYIFNRNIILIRKYWAKSLNIDTKHTIYRTIWWRNQAYVDVQLLLSFLDWHVLCVAFIGKNKNQKCHSNETLMMRFLHDFQKRHNKMSIALVFIFQTKQNQQKMHVPNYVRLKFINRCLFLMNLIRVKNRLAKEYVRLHCCRWARKPKRQTYVVKENRMREQKKV